MSRRPRIRRRGRAASRELPGPVLWTIGLGGIAAVVAMFLVGYNAPNEIPGRAYFTVRAAFDHADDQRIEHQLLHRLVPGKGIIVMRA